MMFKMVRFCAFLLAFASQLHAQMPKSKYSVKSRATATLHTFIVADDTDLDIGSMVDYQTMPKCVKAIAEQSGLTPAIHYFKKTGRNAHELKTKLENLNCGSNDAVFFYYTGHGFNAQGSEFTSFKFDDLQFSMDYVTAQLKEREPRLIVVMYDACNYIPSDRKSIPLRRLASRSDRLKILFRDTKGVVKIASNTAGAGKFSIGLTDKGGLFTNVFYAALENASKNSWESVLGWAKTQTAKIAQDWGKEQVPYYKAETSQMAANQEPIPPPVSGPPDNAITVTPSKPGGAVPEVKKRKRG